jgi:hypothetical protein
MSGIDSTELKQLESRYKATQTATKPAKKKGRGGFITSLISEAGGTGGAIGGASLGATIGSVVPGIGTVIGGLAGAGIGGFLGGTGGRLAENKIRDDEYRVGDALKEGAISGVAGAGPLRLGKLGYGITKGLAKGATPAEEGILEKLVSKGIPVKYTSDELAGRGVQQTTRHTLTNPKVGDIGDTIAEMKGKGFSVNQKLGKTPKQSSQVSSVALTGNRTAVPLSQAGQAEKGIINTPDRYATETFEASPAVSRIQNAMQGGNDALSTSFLGKLTGKAGTRVGERLTEAGSGLKADKNVGGIAKLEDQSRFMTKYTGTPRQQRVAMEKDMKDLSKQVDDVLTKTPVQVDGSLVGQRLKTAMDDLTDERFLDIDLNNPSVSKIIDRYSSKFASAQDAKGVNDIVKTLNKTATRAQEKLVNPNAGPLTAQESAALALKRAGDDVLSEVPEIAPLKKNMAQIFEVTPQVAGQAERGVSTQLLGGVKVKAPIQAGSAAASKIGARLQGEAPAGVPGVKNFASRILAGRGVDLATQPIEEQPAPEVPQTDPSLVGSGGLDMPQEPTYNPSPYAAENLRSSVEKIIQQGGTQKDVAEFLSNAKMFNELNTVPGADKPLSAEASKVVSNANTGIQALNDYQAALEADPSLAAKRVIPGRGLFGGLVGGALGTTGADAAANQIVDVIARLRTGAAITDSEAKRFETFIPQAGDPPETRQQKINYLMNQFQAVASRSGSAGSDLEASLIGA